MESSSIDGRSRGHEIGQIGRFGAEPMIERPTHLVERQPTGRMFGEPASLITVTTTVNQFGEPAHAEASQSITCATAPPSAGDPRVRELSEAGVALEAMRLFWMVPTPRPVADDSAGDIIVYGVERFRVRSVAPWGGFSEVVGVRDETQLHARVVAGSVAWTFTAEVA